VAAIASVKGEDRGVSQRSNDHDSSRLEPERFVAALNYRPDNFGTHSQFIAANLGARCDRSAGKRSLS
jgi:hypothetical protein